MTIVESAMTVNYRQRERILDRLQDHLKILRGSTIGLLGLAFKGGTNDLRDAPALTLIDRLHERGAVIRVHDPVAMPFARREHPELPVTYCDDPVELARDCDAVVVVTDWDDYRRLPLAAMAQAMDGDLVFDARNLLRRSDVEASGLTYLGVGR